LKYFSFYNKFPFCSGYILLLLSYGMNVGAFYAISTLLNQVVLSYFPVSINNFNFFKFKNEYYLKLSSLSQ